MKGKSSNPRRSFLQRVGALLGLGAVAPMASANANVRELLGEPQHKVVYQFNRAEWDYMDHVLFSVGELLRRWGDDVHLVVTAFGPGIHIMAKNPQREIPEIVRQRVASLAMYGVEFHACGNTMKSLNWTAKDMLDFVKVVEIGAEDLVNLQEQGYSYISW